MTEKQNFLDAIAAEPQNYFLRLVYADWLDENNEPEEADRQRKYEQAEKWLIQFAEDCGHTALGYSEAFNEYRRMIEELGGYKTIHEKGLEYPEYPTELENLTKITYEMVVQAGIDYVESRGWEYFTQMGHEQARDLMGDPNIREKYWECWEIVTGLKRLPEEEDDWGTGPFSCSC